MPEDQAQLLHILLHNRPDNYGFLARAFRDGNGANVNLSKAAEWMRKAVEQKIAWANWELFDILWKIGTPESYKEMIDLARPLAESGNREMQARMGRAYRDGKGVDRDLVKAAEWMRKAVEQKIAWANWELFDILWKIGFEGDAELMIALAEDGFSSGVPGATYCLGMANLHGLGTVQNYELALYYFESIKKDIDYSLDVAITVCLLHMCPDDASAHIHKLNKVNKDVVELYEYCILNYNNLVVFSLICAQLSDAENYRKILSLPESTGNKCIITKNCLSLHKLLQYHMIFKNNSKVVPKNVSTIINDLMDYGLSHENYHDADKRDFFKNLPRSTGILNKICNATLSLLNTFDKMCQKYRIEYFCSSGTLLGLLRHNDFVPWDDDIDVFMTRDNLDKLRSNLPKSNVLKLIEYNDKSYGSGKIFRAYKIKFTENCPVFIDIFVFDYIDYVSNNTWKKYSELRDEFTNESIELINSLPEGTKLTGNLSADILIRKYIDKITEELAPNRNKKGLIWGIDNFSCNIPFVLDWDTVYPLKKTNLRGVKCVIPNDPLKILSLNYGDFMRYPPDAFAHSHFRNINVDTLDLCLKEHPL